MTALRRAANGYIVREEFFSAEQWRVYLKHAMSRRRDYRPIGVVERETSAAPPPEPPQEPQP